MLAQQEASAVTRGYAHRSSGAISAMGYQNPDAECELVSVAVVMRVTPADAVRIRAGMVGHPQWVDDVLEYLQREAAYAMEGTFAVHCEPHYD